MEAVILFSIPTSTIGEANAKTNPAQWFTLDPAHALSIFCHVSRCFQYSPWRVLPGGPLSGRPKKRSETWQRTFVPVTLTLFSAYPCGWVLPTIIPRAMASSTRSICSHRFRWLPAATLQHKYCLSWKGGQHSIICHRRLTEFVTERY